MKEPTIQQLEAQPPLNPETLFRFVQSPKKVSSEKEERDLWQQAVIWVWQIKKDYPLFHRLFTGWKENKQRIYLYLERYIKRNYPPAVANRLAWKEMDVRLERIPSNVESILKKRKDHDQLPENIRLMFDKAMEYRDKFLTLRKRLEDLTIADDSPDKVRLQVERADTIQKMLTAYRHMRKKFELYDSVNILHHITINDHYWQRFREENKSDLEVFKQERRDDVKKITDFAAETGIDIQGAKHKTEIPGAIRKKADFFNPPPEWKKSLKAWQMQCIYQYEGQKKQQSKQDLFK